MGAGASAAAAAVTSAAAASAVTTAGVVSTVGAGVGASIAGAAVATSSAAAAGGSAVASAALALGPVGLGLLLGAAVARGDGSDADGGVAADSGDGNSSERAGGGSGGDCRTPGDSDGDAVVSWDCWRDVLRAAPTGSDSSCGMRFVDVVSDVRVARCVVYVTEPSWTLTATSSGARVARLENVWGEVFDVHTVVNVPGLGLALHARRVS